MNTHTQKTLIIIKPDGVQRTLVGEIIQRFERVGLKIIGMKMVCAEGNTVERHYSVDPNWKKTIGEKMTENMRKKGESTDKTPEELGTRVLKKLKNFMTAGPVVAIVLEGAYAIPLTRKLVGTTEPLTSDVGTIRGDYVLDSYALSDGDDRAIRNVIHASGNTEEAEKEIPIWFSPKELLQYNTVHERILYDINFDNVTE